jgi:putative addiction module component (TIGR02574 family)
VRRGLAGYEAFREVKDRLPIRSAIVRLSDRDAPPLRSVGKDPILVVASYGLLNAFAREISVSTTLEALEAEVLKLAPADRSHLLERLIASLDSDPEVEEAWEREADRREAELESGSVAAVPGHEAMARLRAKLSR